MAGGFDARNQDWVRAGEALKTLRKRAGMSQEEAAERADFSVQSWRNYESGRRLVDNPTLAKAVEAVGSTMEAHAYEVAKLAGPPGERSFGVIEDRARLFQIPVGGVAHGGAIRPAVYDDGAEVVDFSSFFTPGTRVLRLSGMSMYPYADAGGFVTYNPRIPARRGQGCVIEMKDGGYYVKRFERLEADTLHVTELYPEERPLTFPLSDVHGVYAIGLRSD